MLQDSTGLEAKPHRVPAVGVVDGVAEPWRVDDGQEKFDTRFLNHKKSHVNTWGSAWHSGSVHAPHPAGPGSILSSEKMAEIQ